MLIKSVVSRSVYLLTFSNDGDYIKDQLLAKKDDYPANFWFFNNALCQIEGEYIHYFKLR